MTTEVFLGQTAIFASETMHRFMEHIRRVAQTDATVLISGESGSGKELIARAIYHYSLRCSRPWVDVNAGAFPEHLVESELFGYEKGAFSGADSVKPGLLETADKGVLFLDEVGELEPKMQVKLLRVLDGAPYYRLGGVRKVSVNVRVVAATNKDLKRAVEAGEFRSDLYYRLSQVHVHVPPLRERPECMVALAEYFLQQFNPSLRFAPEVLQLLQGYAWPGNIRELRNVVTNASIVAQRSEIRPCDLPVEIANAVRPAKLPSNIEMSTPASIPVLRRNLDEMQKEMILRVLDESRGHQGRAAEILGISRRTLYRKLKSFGMETTDANEPEDAPDRSARSLRHLVPNDQTA